MVIDAPALLMNGLWAGLFAAALGTLMTTPPRYLAAAFTCGVAGRLARDLGVASGVSVNWATALAAALVVLVAAAVTRHRRVSPGVLICGVLPLGAAVAMFNVVFGLMRLSAGSAGAIGDAAQSLVASVARVFVVSLAIAVGIGVGLAIVRVFTPDDASGT